jgi:hypothetical protein
MSSEQTSSDCQPKDHNSSFDKDVDNDYDKGPESSSSYPPPPSTSMLRVLCLHDEYSNALRFSKELDVFATRLYENHGIDLVFINSPLLAREQEQEQTTAKFNNPDESPRVWWEEEEVVVHNNDTTDVGKEDEKKKEETQTGTDDNIEGKAENDDDDNNDNDNNNDDDDAGPKKRYVGMDASLLLLRQVWTSTPYWGLLAVGQAASVASFLPLMEVSPRPSFCIFVEGITVLEEDELLIEDLPCLHVVGMRSDCYVSFVCLFV